MLIVWCHTGPELAAFLVTLVVPRGPKFSYTISYTVVAETGLNWQNHGEPLRSRSPLCTEFPFCCWLSVCLCIPSRCRRNHKWFHCWPGEGAVEGDDCRREGRGGQHLNEFPV